MAFLEWNKELDTGIEVIDVQHRRIVDYINRLQDAIEKRQGAEITAVFNDLMDYTVTHFSFEEGLQEQAGYEYRNAHRRVHEVFTKKLGNYRERFHQGDIAAAREVNDMLRNWLVTHIKNDDADYVPMVRQVVDSGKKKGWIAGSLKKLFG